MDIYSDILAALRTEQRVMLATIIATSGSTPAAAFSKMLLKEGGIVSVGTVGGGCMEGEVLLQANRLLDSGKAKICTFHLSEDDVEHGLICGGSLDVLIEPIGRDRIPLLRELNSMRDDGADCIIVSLMGHDGAMCEKFLVNPAPAPGTRSADIALTPHECAARIGSPETDVERLIAHSHRRQETSRVSVGNGELIIEPVSGTPALVIFGGGHVAKYVSRAAAMAGFNVTIVDDREKYACQARFPEAAWTIVVDYPSAFQRLAVTSSTYIVIITRGHQHDEEILRQALATPAKYIGMIGSKRKVLTVFEHLLDKQISFEMLERVHAPIGLDIGAVTAEEIGISIVAELIGVRRSGGRTIHHKSDPLHELLPRTGL